MKERNPRPSDAASVDRFDVPLELLLGLEGHRAFFALEKSAGPLVLLHVLLQFVLGEERFPTFLAR